MGECSEKSKANSASPFLFSPTLDAAAFLLPVVLALLLTPTAWLVPKLEVPLWAHLG